MCVRCTLKGTMRFGDFDGVGSTAFWEWDLIEDRLQPSPQLPGLLGYSHADFPSDAFLGSLVHPDDRGALLGKLAAFRAGALPELQSQHRLRRGDGRWVWVFLRGEVVSTGEGKAPSLARGLLFDAQAHVQLLESLLYEKDSLQATLSAMRDALFATDAFGTVTMMNDAALALLATDDALAPLGAAIYEVLPLFRKSDGSAVTGYVERAVQEALPLEYTHNVLLRLPNRGALEVSVVVSPMHLEEGSRTGAVVMVEDVSEKRRHEEELRQVQKLDSLARLARGISHDLNDSLAALLGELSLFRERVDEGIACDDELENIESSARAIRKISQQLSLFGTREPPVMAGSSVEELLRDAVDYALRGSEISVSYTIETPIWDIPIDPQQFGQLIQNLIMNARDAMEESGTVHIEVRNGGPISAEAPPGTHSVRIRVTDEGPGIPEETVPFIFDPYFTTKDRGGGLGLTIARSIATSHGGSLSLDSEVGFGTTCRLIMPAVPQARRSQAASGEAQLPRNKRILILEDDELVLSVIDRMVRLLGSKPTSVASGEEAVDRALSFFEEGFPFDLMITDVSVRGTMSGLDALKQIHSFQPELPTVLTTAYTPAIGGTTDPYYAQLAVLPKPFTVEDLRALFVELFRG